MEEEKSVTIEKKTYQESEQSCTKTTELKEKIEKVIVESNVDYKEAIYVLNWLVSNYRDRGDNLLNATNIQKVIDTPRFIR